MRKLLFLLLPAIAVYAVLSCSADDGMPCYSCGDPYPLPYIPRQNYTGGSCDVDDYGSVEIGSQVWMAKNWGCYVPDSRCYCYNNDPANCEKYGCLYDWAAAMGIDERYNFEEWGGSDVNHKGICPSGWHIPSNNEWNVLINFVERDRGCRDCAGKYLKATSGWNDYEGKSGNGENTYGFAALPAGYTAAKPAGNPFWSIGNSGSWWSATENNDFCRYVAYRKTMHYNDEFVSMDDYCRGDKFVSISVRCVKD
ncbi:MAG: hypothetical protein LBC64_07690 [Fibromonadaceae bacterium]|jgi:uncharacterized protein (TIGR02145 family)|nr:hypothetical protein [Fibromonadaceae bacterium]